MRRIKTALIIMMLLALATPAIADYGAVASRKAKLYTDEELVSEVGTLAKYTAVVVQKVSSGVARIKHDGKVYFVSNKALTKPWDTLEARLHSKGIDTTWEYNRYTKKSCYVYTYPSKSAAKKKVKKNLDLSACHVKDGWTLVECNGYYGYIQSKYLGKRTM